MVLVLPSAQPFIDIRVGDQGHPNIGGEVYWGLCRGQGDRLRGPLINQEAQTPLHPPPSIIHPLPNPHDEKTSTGMADIQRVSFRTRRPHITPPPDP